CSLKHYLQCHLISLPQKLYFSLITSFILSQGCHVSVYIFHLVLANTYYHISCLHSCLSSRSAVQHTIDSHPFTCKNIIRHYTQSDLKASLLPAVLRRLGLGKLKLPISRQNRQ